jgi:signal transduction histidine kinase
MPEAGVNENAEPSPTDLGGLIAARVPDILKAFESALRSVDSPLLEDDRARTQVMAHARDIVEKTAQELGGRTPPEIHFGLPREIGVQRATSGVHPSESLRAADLLFGVVIKHLAIRADELPTAAQIALVATTLHDVLARNLRIAADSYIGVLLNRVHQAQVDERRRISRELHDHIGHGIGVAQRNLELFEIYRPTEPDRAMARVEAARRVLTASLAAVRQAISDLRLVEPMESLEKALTLFLEESAAPSLVRHVEVNGDEAWAPTETIEEAFLITREALRNTLAHADASKVLVRIDISPSELRASVVDDGRGFDPRARAASGGTGLLSMRERAALLGGSLLLRSVPGQGTHMELRVPLGGGGPA